ncbi:hypothetical protein BASA62_009754 [Batrachochytrium salamandrivorans]|nr:hypothetical protein BASA62_009754 [Batrachochytrium salamandrivorans]
MADRQYLFLYSCLVRRDQNQRWDFTNCPWTFSVNTSLSVPEQMALMGVLLVTDPFAQQQSTQPTVIAQSQQILPQSSAYMSPRMGSVSRGSPGTVMGAT